MCVWIIPLEQSVAFLYLFTVLFGGFLLSRLAGELVALVVELSLRSCSLIYSSGLTNIALWIALSALRGAAMLWAAATGGVVVVLVATAFVVSNSCINMAFCLNSTYGCYVFVYMYVCIVCSRLVSFYFINMSSFKCL